MAAMFCVQILACLLYCDPLMFVCNNVRRVINPFIIDVSVHGWWVVKIPITNQTSNALKVSVKVS